MPKESLTRKPSKEDQRYCIKVLKSNDEDIIGGSGCVPLTAIGKEILATIVGTNDSEILELGISRQISRVKECQHGCIAINYAKRLSLDSARFLGCNQMIDVGDKIINGEISRNQITDDVTDDELDY